MFPEPYASRFFAKIEKRETGCWVWIASKNEDGYGMFRYEGRTRHAHRLAYEVLVGPVPDGRELDHLCRVRACVNPAHLEPVPHRENVLRGESFGRENALKTHCSNGHEFTPENTMVWRGPKMTMRICRECARARARARNARRRAEAIAAGTYRPPPSAQTSCINGHPFDEENTCWLKDGSRACRTCQREAKRRYNEKRKRENYGDN